MQNFLGTKQIQQIKAKLKNTGTELAEKTTQKIKETNISYSEISEDLPYNNYQISYFLRNPNNTPPKTIIQIAKKTKEILNSDYKESKKKFVVHPTKIYPDNADPFYLSSQNIAEIFCVNFGQCISSKFATEKAKKDYIHLKLTKNV